MEEVSRWGCGSMVGTVDVTEMRRVRKEVFNCYFSIIDIIDSFTFQPLCPLLFNSSIRLCFAFDRDSFHTINVLRKAHERLMRRSWPRHHSLPHNKQLVGSSINAWFRKCGALGGPRADWLVAAIAIVYCCCCRRPDSSRLV